MAYDAFTFACSVPISKAATVDPMIAFKANNHLLTDQGRLALERNLAVVAAVPDRYASAAQIKALRIHTGSMFNDNRVTMLNTVFALQIANVHMQQIICAADGISDLVAKNIAYGYGTTYNAKQSHLIRELYNSGVSQVVGDKILLRITGDNQVVKGHKVPTATEKALVVATCSNARTAIIDGIDPTSKFNGTF